MSMLRPDHTIITEHIIGFSGDGQVDWRGQTELVMNNKFADDTVICSGSGERVKESLVGWRDALERTEMKNSGEDS